MTQFARPTLDAAVDDGITLSTKLNGAWPAVYSSHYGAAAPPTPDKGQVWLDTSAEGGAPPILTMKQYDGTTWRTLWSINKTTGVVTSAGLDLYLPLAGGTLTGDLTLSEASPTLIVNKLASGQAAAVVGKIGNVNRWSMHLGGIQTDAAEAGSDFLIQRHNDAGTLNTTPAIAVERLTGKVGFGCQVVALATVDARFYQRCDGVDIARGSFLHNSQTTAGASVDVRFACGTTSNIRARIRAQKEGSANAGKLVLGTYLGATESDVLVLDSSTDAYFARHAYVAGAVVPGVSTDPAHAMTIGYGQINFLSLAGGAVSGSLAAGGVISNPDVQMGYAQGCGVKVLRSFSDGVTYTQQRAIESAGFSGLGFALDWIHRPGVAIATQINTNGVNFDFRADGNAYAPGSWLPASDARLKTDQEPLGDVRDIIMGLVPKSYLMGGKRKFGVIAQEARAHIPDAVIDTGWKVPGDPDGPNMLAFDYNGLLAHMLRHIQRLETRVAALERAP